MLTEITPHKSHTIHTSYFIHDQLLYFLPPNKNTPQQKATLDDDSSGLNKPNIDSSLPFLIKKDLVADKTQVTHP